MRIGTRRIAAVVLVAFGSATTAYAADRYWDINGAGTPAIGDYNSDGKVDAADYVVWRDTNINGAQGYTDWRTNFGNVAAGAGGATPSGNWDSSTPNWSTSPAGSVATQVWNPAGIDVAVFSAGADATGAYTVTVDSQTASGLRLEDGDVSISSGTLTLTTGSGINVLSGRTMTIDGTLTNSAGNTVSKDGTGTLVLSGANTLAGTFTLNSGTVSVGNSSAFGSTAGSSTLNISGGSLSNNTATVVNVSNAVKTNINGNFSVDTSASGNHLISFQSSVPGGGQVLTGNRTITVNGAPTAGSNTADLAGLAFNNLQDGGNNYGITKQGTGTLRFEGPNSTSTFTGDVTVQQGFLEVSPFGWIGGKVAANPAAPGQAGGNTINLAGGNFNVTGTRSGANPINNPFVITAPAKFTMTLTTSFTGTLSETFFGGISTPNNSKITFENTNPNAPATGTNTSCPAEQPNCSIYYARFAGALGFTYPGDVEIKNHATIANQLTRLSNFNTTGTTITWSGVMSGGGQFSRSATTGGTGGNTILTGANTYSGLTLISDGTIYVNNTSGSGTGSGPIWVNFGDSATFYNAGAKGTLAGNGSTTSAILVGRRGYVSPGTIASPIAAFSGGALTFSDANTLFPSTDPAAYVFDLNSSLSPSVGADLLNVNGNLALGGTFAALTVTDLAATSAALANLTKFTLMSYSGTWDGNIFNGLADDTGTITVSSGGGATNTFTINYNDTTPGSNLGGGLYSKYVTLTRISAGSGAALGGDGAVPEPSSAVFLMLFGFAGGAWRQHRQR